MDVLMNGALLHVAAGDSIIERPTRDGAGHRNQARSSTTSTRITAATMSGVRERRLCSKSDPVDGGAIRGSVVERPQR